MHRCDLAATFNTCSEYAKVHEAVRVAPFVVVPRHELHEVLVQRDARLDVEDRRELVADEVRAHNLGIFRYEPKQIPISVTTERTACESVIPTSEMKDGSLH